MYVIIHVIIHVILYIYINSGLGQAWSLTSSAVGKVGTFKARMFFLR